jgi:hypothetical protein
MSEMKEWTLMFYFASDNPLAPGIVAQMKSIKYAGFHPEANVIAQFDPNTAGTPTHIFDFNHINKIRSHGAPNIGFNGNDPFVRNMIEDKLWRDQKDRDGKTLIKDRLKQKLAEEQNIDFDKFDFSPPMPPKDSSTKEMSPKESLESFLNFCCDNYPARHYMLFILGHGLVVGNDIFLFDEHAVDKSLSLKELGEVLANFREQIIRHDAKFELVGFHSCSVSSLEVAYELQGTANFMLASQSPAFIGSWPYRQILIRLFNDLVDKGAGIDVKEMLVKIFYFCLYNSMDFLLAGYSFDLCLCDLNKVSNMNEPLQELSKALIAGLEVSGDSEDSLEKDFILLSHLKSQSYWQEPYTDLYDFCLCLSKRCERSKKPGEEMSATLQAIHTACTNVMQQLVKGVEGDDDRFIVRSEFAGPEYQFSHGLSVFFPWSQPLGDNNILTQYKEYKFSKELEPSSWLSFLNKYFDKTMRNSRKSDSEKDVVQPKPRKVSARKQIEADLNEDIASLIYNGEGPLSMDSSLSVLKVNPLDGIGGDCTCGSIKNHLRDTRPRAEREKQADKKLIQVSDNFFQQFRMDDD